MEQEKKIMIVEDDWYTAEDTKSMLESLGYVVSAIESSGERAIKTAEQQLPDLVLMDIILKGKMDGIEAAAQIRTRFNIPIVYVTAYADEELLARAKITEPFGYITKPFEKAALHTMVEIALHKHKTEEELRESEDKYRTILENMEEGYYEVDLAGSFTFVNDAMCRIRGMSRDELIGTNNRDYMTPETAKEVYEAFSKVYATGEPERNLGWETIRPDGTKRYVETSTSLIRNSGNKPTGFRGVVRDVTERRRSEQALLESNRLNGMLLDSLPHPAMLIDPSRHVIAANKIAREAGAQIGGYCWQTFGNSLSIPEEHKHYMDTHDGAIPIGGTQCTFCLADESLAKQESAYTEVTVGGTVFDTWWVPIDEGMFLHYTVDITERKQAEQEKERLESRLQQALKMEAIGTLAGGIAHDFNNILGIIMGCTELSLHDIPKDTPIREHLTEVLTATHRARDLVKQILTFSRQSKQDEKPLAMGIIIKEALKMLRSSLPTTIEIQQNIEKDSGLIMADPTQIHQIIMNLSTNASHAMGEKGGVLNVSVADIEIDDQSTTQNPDLEPGSYVELTVSDTGHGMQPEVMERIFEPYYTTKEIGKGTGLGLSVVHGIVLSHGGVIDVHSEAGKGTTFEIFFPKIDLGEDRTGIKAKEKILAGNERILFVDDEPAMANIYQSMLERLGYAVSIRTSSVEALEAFKAQPDKYDLIITDQTMPHLTGQMLAKEMMAIRSDIPIIICTGHSDLINEDRARKMGIRAFVMKPIAMTEIARTIRDVLERRKR